MKFQLKIKSKLLPFLISADARVSKRRGSPSGLPLRILIIEVSGYNAYLSKLITALPFALTELTKMYALYFLSAVSTQVPASARNPNA